jgi:peptidoglycan hydrolase-like protein with peptidoglycan-binding domain
MVVATLADGGDTDAPGAVTAADVLGLQRAAGNSAVSRLLGAATARDAAARRRPLAVSRQVAGGVTAPAVRPHLRTGEISEMVGVAQQKLVATGAGPNLVIDAEFGPKTRAAVSTFQRRNGIRASGEVDAGTWAALDTQAPGGERDATGALTPVRAPGVTPNPVGPTPSPTSEVHPVLRQGSKGPSVAELHEKLNAANGSGLPTAAGLDAADAIEFTADTDAAVRAFQRARRLVVDGVVGRNTWRTLDRLVPASAVGRTDRTMVEQARGKDFGGPVRTDWALEPNRANPERLRVRVRYDYQDDPTRPVNHAAEVTALLDGIRTVWNQFQAVEQPLVPGTARPPVPIEFDPREESPADQRVLLSSGVGPSNSGHYFIDASTDRVMLGAHEFGHHIGLQDEYQQTAGSHLRQTGFVAPVGDVTGPAPPKQIAREIGQALRSPPRAAHGPNTLAVIQGYGLTQGAFAQQVAGRYRNLFGTSVIFDCNRLIDTDPSEGPLSMQRRCTHPFLYNEAGLMAGAEMEDPSLSGASPGEPDHRHAVEPRHVVEYVGIVARGMGGIWEPGQR